MSPFLPPPARPAPPCYRPVPRAVKNKVECPLFRHPVRGPTVHPIFLASIFFLPSLWPVRERGSFTFRPALLTLELADGEGIDTYAPLLEGCGDDAVVAVFLQGENEARVEVVLRDVVVL